MRIPVNNLMPGLQPDGPDLLLPDGVFSDSRNFRFRDNAVEKVKGYSSIFGSLSVTPIWASYVGTGTSSFWVYGNETVLYGTDGTTHTNISSITYAATPSLGYTGGRYHGYMIANDAVAAPQYWNPSLSNKFQPLSNWPASTTCKVIRPFKDFLFALRVTESGTYNPRLLRWSDIGGVASLPGSWDYTDPTTSAGRTELGDTDDYLIDCLPLRDVNIIYKQFTTYIAVWLPDSSDVFQFRRIFDQSGLLSENCVAAFGPLHFAVTADDLIVHDGSNVQRVANKRVRRTFFSMIDQSNYQKTFVAHNFRDKEMWVCFAQSGHTYPNIALCWDYANDNWYFRDFASEMSTAAPGIVSGNATTFSTVASEFDADTAPFDQDTVSAFANQLVLFTGNAPGAYQAENTETQNGTAMTCYATRSNMALTQDVGSIKRVKRIFPKALGTAGETLAVYVGASDTPDSAITWSGPFNFTIGTDYKIDCRVSGRYVHVKFQYTGTNTVRLAAYDVEFDALEGER